MSLPVCRSVLVPGRDHLAVGGVAQVLNNYEQLFFSSRTGRHAWLHEVVSFENRAEAYQKKGSRGKDLSLAKYARCCLSGGRLDTLQVPLYHPCFRLQRGFVSIAVSACSSRYQIS